MANRFAVILPVLVAALARWWVFHASMANHWLAVHTGTVNGRPVLRVLVRVRLRSDQLGIIGVISTGVYQLFKKYNCHEPGCWRVGTHPAAGGQFVLCYRHHPDYQGVKPTHELIERLHREHLERQAAIHARVVEIHEDLSGGEVDTGEVRRGPTP